MSPSLNAGRGAHSHPSSLAQCSPSLCNGRLPLEIGGYGWIQINLKTRALFSTANSFLGAIYIQETIIKEQVYCSASKAIPRRRTQGLPNCVGPALPVVPGEGGEWGPLTVTVEDILS